MNNKKFGFTLAEVLITLAIIGVVAALTLPTLISNHKDKITVTKVRKMYATLSSAYKLYLSENQSVVCPHSDDGTGAICTYNIFKPYLQISNECGLEDLEEKCIGTYTRKNGNAVADYKSSKRYFKVGLLDGSALIFRGGGKIEYSEIFYDVNGPQGPNKWGNDVFDFYIHKAILYPNGPSTFEDDCATSTGAGWGCAVWVVEKGNLDYLKCPDKLTLEDSGCH